jgi:Uri superfamily endonuclease
MNEDAADSPRAEPGTYALLLRVPIEERAPEREQTIEVGALGRMTVRPGPYVYVGSAFGPGGVRARVRRHARDDGARHWHVDYLRAVARLEAVWYTHDQTRRECAWATALRSRPAAEVPLDGVGASDCDCPGHLVTLPTSPSLAQFRERLRAEHPDHAAIGWIDGDALVDG